MTKTMTTTMPVAATETYAAAYATLTNIAQRLSTGSGATIDNLAADVRAAHQAHATCRARLDAIRREVEAEAAEPAAKV